VVPRVIGECFEAREILPLSQGVVARSRMTDRTRSRRYACVVRPAHDDACHRGGGTCVDSSRYCGRDKLDGDLQTLYVCIAGAGISQQRCAAGCLIRAGNDDVRR
jgi:hypothetical protein